MLPHAYTEGDLIAGKYLLVRQIGEGAMGSVWHARDIFLGIQVALKMLRPEHRVAGPQREYLAERLTREATTLAGIRHPAIVRVYDFGASSWNDPFLAMELLDGESLGSLLERSGQLFPEYAVQIMLPIAHGLAAAHDQGVVHRDIKPDNLFLSIDGRIEPKLIDFGLVKLTHGQGGRKLTGVGFLGTLDYMAPEQALELPNVDHRSDVWAFCVVLYEALSGEPPFCKPTFAETFGALLQREPAPLTAIGLDPALWEIIARGLRKSPDERWQSMHDLGTALARWLLSRAVNVDVTGAALHTQWAAEVVAPRQPRLSEGLHCQTEQPLHPTTRVHRAPQRSGLRLRWRRKRPARPDAVVPVAPKASAWRIGCRLALSGAIAAGIMIAPEPQWLEEASALAGLLGQGRAPEGSGDSDVSGTAVVRQSSLRTQTVDP